MEEEQPAQPAQQEKEQHPKQWLHQNWGQRWKGRLEWRTDRWRDKATGRWRARATVECSGGAADVGGVLTPLPAGVHAFDAEAGSLREAHAAAAAAARAWCVERGFENAARSGPALDGLGGLAKRHRVRVARQHARNPLVFFDVEIGGRPVGRAVLELYAHTTPMAAENFRRLCVGDAPSADGSGRLLAYAGTLIHRVERGTLVQGGDVSTAAAAAVAGVGTSTATTAAAAVGAGGESIYGPMFEDEEVGLEIYRHRLGTLSMANLGREHTNASQFLLVTGPCSALNGRHVVCGQLLRGFGVLREIEHTPVDAEGAPLERVVIAAAGQLPADYDLSAVPLVTLGDWPKWAEDLEPPLDLEPTEEARFRLVASAAVRRAANELYRAGDAAGAEARYGQALRMLSWVTFRGAGGGDAISHAEQCEIYDAELALRSNRAASLLRLRRWREAAEEAGEVLHRRPDDAVALYRLGRAHMGVGELDDAAAALRRAAALEPPSAEVRAALDEVGAIRRRRAVKERAAFSAAFARGLLGRDEDDEGEGEGAAAAAEDATVLELVAAASGGGGDDGIADAVDVRGAREQLAPWFELGGGGGGDEELGGGAGSS